MRRYIIGMLMGIVLATSISAHAEVISLINKTVDGMFPVTVDGKSVGSAIVVDNKTYLPVREFGEAAGYTVTFTDAREVVMTKNTVLPTPVPSTTPSPQPTAPTMTKEQKIQQIQGRIEFLKMRINADKGGIEMNKDTPDLPIVVTWKETVAKNEKEIADLQAQLDALQK